MPRFFFHYRIDDELIHDTDGCELPDLEAAEQSATALAQAIIEQAANVNEDTRIPRSIEISDAYGKELLYLVFWVGPRLGTLSRVKGDREIEIKPVVVH